MIKKKEPIYWVIKSPNGIYSTVRDGSTPRLYKSEGIAKRCMSREQKLGGFTAVPVKLMEIDPEH